MRIFSALGTIAAAEQELPMVQLLLDPFKLAASHQDGTSSSSTSSGGAGGLGRVAECYSAAVQLNNSQAAAVVQVATAAGAGKKLNPSSSWRGAGPPAGSSGFNSSTMAAGQQQGKRPSVVLIQGPPGTGKTSTLAPLLSLLMGTGQRVLAAAPTNAAIGELATKLLRTCNSSKLFQDHAATCNTCRQAPGGRAGAAAGSAYQGGAGEVNSHAALPFRLAHVVLVHSTQSSNAVAAFQQLSMLSLNQRVELLQWALGPWGWGASRQRLLKLLLEAPQQHTDAMRAAARDSSSSSSSSSSGSDTDDVPGSSSRSRGSRVAAGFWEWLAPQLQQLAAQLVDMAGFLEQQVPDSYLGRNPAAVLQVSPGGFCFA
jgi:hypothetical protein